MLLGSLGFGNHLMLVFSAVLFIYLLFICVCGTWVMSQCCNCVFSSSGCIHIYMYFNIYVRWHDKGMHQVPHWGEKNKKWEIFWHPCTIHNVFNSKLSITWLRQMGHWYDVPGWCRLEKNLTSLPRKIEVCPFSWFSFCFNNKYFLSVGEGWSA